MKRICIIDPNLTRYRMPVLAELSERCPVDWIFSPLKEDRGYGTFTRLQAPGLRYVEVPLSSPFGERAGMYQWGIVKYLFRENPDLVRVFANPRYLSFWTTLVAARALNIPFYAHGVGFFKRPRISRLRRWMMNVMLRLVSSYICYTPTVRQSFADHNFALDKISVAHNSLINPYPVTAEEKTGEETGLLFVGRLRPRSGLPLLFKVLKRLKERGFPFTLHVVGVGEEETELRRAAAGLSFVIWHGEASDLEVSQISRECIAGCYPGNAGLSVVHMMSLSLPVVIHNDLQFHEGPEPGYIQDEVNGLLYDRSNPEESLYLKLLELRPGAEKVKRMQEMAFATYRDLTKPSYADRLWAIFNGEPAHPAVMSPAAAHSD